MRTVPRRRSKLLLSCLAVTVSIGLYYLLHPPFGEGAAAVSVLPVAVIATLYGTKAGLLASAVAFPFNTFLLQALFDGAAAVSPLSSLISVSLFGVAWLFGRFHSLRTQLSVATSNHRQAVAALRISEDRLRGFLDTTPDLILRLGSNGRLLEVQGEHNLSIGIRKEDHLFRPLDSLLPPGVADRIITEAALAQEGERRNVEIPFPFGHEERLMQVTLVPSGEREVMALVRPAPRPDLAPGEAV